MYQHIRMPNKGSSKNFISPESSLEIPPCEPKKCRINCRKNPNCFSQLGEKFWFNDIKESHWIGIEDPNNDRKEENGHVGLKNLGATCYVNTFLQLWFHHKPLRSAIYQWNTTEAPIETIEPTDDVEADHLTGPKHISLSYGDDSTKAICGSLQYLFCLLEHSCKRFVDPSPLVKSLGLQTDEQQDAQEFSKLFILLLQEALSSQGHENIVEQQFGGSYVYETKCGFCQSVSERHSEFYELDLNIEGHVRLSQFLKGFLKEEVLEGDNQYFCSTCQRKQDATRRIALKRLPRVLNLQLLRFVFDRQTFTKKKLNTTVSFPDTLDMNDYVSLDNKSDGIYQLKAVLLHKGLSANSGHYIAHIWDQQNEVWCRFNDEEVDVLKGKTLQLEREEKDEVMLDEAKPTKVKKQEGFHSSKNAYMLVYTKASDSELTCAVKAPPSILDIVQRDNTLFEDWVDTVNILRESSISKGLRKQEEVKHIYSRLAVEKGEDYEWISTKWLRDWLSSEKKAVPPIDNTELMCAHSCLDPLKIPLMKRVSAGAARDLFDKHGGIPRFKSDAMCKKCLEFLKAKHNFDFKLQDDLKQLTRMLKENSTSYWVGKKSLKQFKQLATKEFLNAFDVGASALTNGITPNTSECELGDNNNNTESDDEQKPSQDNVLDADLKLSSKSRQTTKLHTFNQDILCPIHGDLSLNESARRLVSRDVWSKCLEYFPSLRAFPSDAPECLVCHEKLISEEEERETMKTYLSNQKQCLSFLFDDPNERMETFLLQKGKTSFYVVVSSFVNAWKKKAKTQKPFTESMIDNSEMICEHDLLLYEPEELISELSKREPEVIAIGEEHKETMTNFFAFVPEVKITINKAATAKKHTATTYQSYPDYCVECRKERLSEEAFDSKCFSDAPIYVRKLTGDHNVTVDESKRNDNSPSSPDDAINIVDEAQASKESEKSRPEKSRPEKSRPDDDDDDTKKLKKVHKNVIQFLHPPKRFKESPKKASDLQRRSTRYRRKRGEYTVYIDSHQTLRDLKVQLLSVFSVFPLEQILTLSDGVALTEDNSFLVDLGITPGKHLFLSVAEQDKTQIDNVDRGKKRVREEGFKGTNLLCGGKGP